MHSNWQGTEIVLLQSTFVLHLRIRIKYPNSPIRVPFLSEVRSRPLLLCASGRLPVLHSSVFRYAQENRYTRVPGTCALLSRDTRFTGGTKLDNKRQTAWKGADLKWMDSPSCNCLKYRVHFYASGHECELNEGSLPLGHFFFTLSIIEAEHDLPHLGRVNYP